MNLSKRVIAIGTASAVTLAAMVPAVASPAMSQSASLAKAAPSDVIDVRWRRGGAIAAGAVAGLALGGLAAAAASSPYYYGYGPRAYGYDDGPYGYDPGYAPAYYGPPAVAYEAAPPAYYAPRGCWVTTETERNYGYVGACRR